MSALTRYDKARKALAEAHRIDEVKEIMNQAASVAEYARRARDLEMIRWATEIQQDAARKAGEMLRDRDMAKGGNPNLPTPTSVVAVETLAKLGISHNQSSRWQALAALDDDAFEARKAAASRAAVASVERTREERCADKKERRAAREVELGARIAALPGEKYGAIVADPEWEFDPYSIDTGMDRAAGNHYPTSATSIIAARDVASIAADDCVLFLWATVPMFLDAAQVMASWGFTYQSNYVWIKDRIGTGYWNRNQHEHLLVGTRGDIPAPAPGTQWPSVIHAPAIGHSVKPEIFLEMIEAYYPNLPKVELNRRGAARPGWSGWGNEFEPAKAAE